jgi:hypothetical protein
MPLSSIPGQASRKRSIQLKVHISNILSRMTYDQDKTSNHLKAASSIAISYFQ